MRIASIISFTIAAAIFTYLIGATLGSPFVPVSDDVTTSVPDVQNDDVDATTQVVFADEPVTVESVTKRARQDGDEEDDDDDDDTTGAPVSSTRAPVPPPAGNESTILTEFNFVAQPVEVKPVPAVVPDTESVDEEDDPDQPAATQVPAQEQQKAAVQEVQEPEDNDSDNEITQDEAGTTAKSTFETEFKYTVENFNKIKTRDESKVSENDVEIARQDDIAQADITTTFNPISGNYSDDPEVNQEWEYSAQTLFDGEGRAGCECGKLPFRIPISEQSGINPNPWMVAIVRGGLFAGGRPHCSGSLINNLYVLTSASCMDGLYPSSIQVWLTAHNTFDHHQATFGNVKVNVQEIIMHPNYERRSKDNDLCLVKLTQSVDITSQSYFVPVCLPAGSFNFAGTIAKVAGWSDGRADNKVCKADMPILDNKICNRDSKHSGKITGNMVCAGYLTPTRVEQCIGDAGGPLVSPNGGRSTLVGIVSWGYEAKNRDYSPTVYTRVSEFSDWILHNTRDADWCGV